MALGIYTGGTANATNGTLVSSSNKITFTALSPSYITAHVRTDTADTYTNDQSFTIPTGVEISFDSGITWKGVSDSPYTYPLVIGDLNQAMRIRQTAIQVSSVASLVTAGTFSSCTALSDVGSFTATDTGAGGTVSLSWGAVTNRTYYEIQAATDSGFTTNLTTLTSTETSTSYSASSLTDGTTYYFRVKAVGTGQYKDSASWATTNATPSSLLSDSFASLDTTNTWVAVTSGSGSVSTSGGVAIIEKPAQADKASLVAKAGAISTGSTRTITALVDVSGWGGAFNQAGVLQVVRQTATPTSSDTHSTDYVPFAVEFFNDGTTPYQCRFRYRSSGGSDLYYDSTAAWTASPVTYFNLPSGDNAQYQAIIEMDATNGIRGVVKTADGSSTVVTSAWVAWASLGGSGSNLWVAFAGHQWQSTSSSAFNGTLNVDSVAVT